MSLAALAAQEGMKAKSARTIASWLVEHPDLKVEIAECRALGYTWGDLVKLLRKHYQFPFTDHDGLRVAIENEQRPQDAG